eukprot:CAMPEP_0168534670 /NCGR_PEP_ID=MMETSP0405-20121227/18100_1 /TAXON_ID=498012 /ORGANISM="Trichosphaerium sp, Strain Am-I-7 wt" /LENGTH=173 /DNA_ID=CAMNT_0008561545 /DNA_START=83 /DNA_END=604 /DNA_ORIENTATION=+
MEHWLADNKEKLQQVFTKLSLDASTTFIPTKKALIINLNAAFVLLPQKSNPVRTHDFFYENAIGVVKHRSTGKRFGSVLQEYDFIMSLSRENKANQVPEILLGSAQAGTNSDNKSWLEMRAKQRDYKRRRQSYRAKNTHLTKRTPTQVARDTIGMLMAKYDGEKSSNSGVGDE